LHFSESHGKKEPPKKFISGKSKQKAKKIEKANKRARAVSFIFRLPMI
jgi:hypothetical protein